MTSLALGLALGLGPGAWPPGQALGLITFALWGGWDPGPGPPQSRRNNCLQKKSSKTLCVFTSFGLDHICGPTLPGPDPGLVFTSLALGHGPGPWPPGLALGLIAFALWGGWDPGPGPLPKSTQQLLPKKIAKHCVFSPVSAGTIFVGRCSLPQALAMLSPVSALGPGPGIASPGSLRPPYRRRACRRPQKSKFSRFKIFKISRFQDFKIFKISRFQDFKFSRFQVFKIFKISRF